MSDSITSPSLDLDKDQVPAKVGLIEAGTGTGKTLSYLISALPWAVATKKKLIVATATTNLQDQLLVTELPKLTGSTSMKFSYALAKGQSRYCCIRKLMDNNRPEPETANHSTASQGNLFKLVSEMTSPEEEGKEFASPEMEFSKPKKQFFKKVFDLWEQKLWDGDKDHWTEEGFREEWWHHLRMDRDDCDNSRCQWFMECPYYMARNRVFEVDLVITNHHLLLADLRIGGGKLLPEISKSLLILDEAHRFPENARDQLTAKGSPEAMHRWSLAGSRVVSLLKKRGVLPNEAESALANIVPVIENFKKSCGLLKKQVKEILARPDQRNLMENNFLFDKGLVPERLAKTSLGLSSFCKDIIARLDAICLTMELQIDNDEGLKDSLNPFLSITKLVSAKFHLFLEIFLGYSQGSEFPLDEKLRGVRWIEKASPNDEDSFRMCSAPLIPGSFLDKALWQKVPACILTSATLRSLNRFDWLRQETGLGEIASEWVFPSPFRFSEKARFIVPADAASGALPEQHTRKLIEQVPKYLNETKGILVLFASFRQLNQVHGALSRDISNSVLSQSVFSRSEAVRRHKQKIDAGLKSILFGVLGFAEGVDLPGKYCERVIITKLAFPTPVDPFIASKSSWVKHDGGNAFVSVSLPVASMHLIQASGRLLRNETDSGDIILLDGRVRTKSYGRLLLNALPPFKGLV